MTGPLTNPDLVLVFGVVIAVALWAPFVILRVRRNPSLGWRALFLVSALEAFVSMPSTRVGPIEVGPFDAVIYLIFAVAIIRARDLNRWPVAMIAVLGIFALNIARSLGEFGVGGAELAFRAELFFLAAVIFGATLDASDLERLLSDIRTLALVYAGAAVSRWLGLTEGVDTFDTVFLESRAVPAAYAATMAIGMLYSLWVWLTRRAGRSALAFAVLLGVFVVLTQHRSVWVATLVGLAVLIVVQPAARLRKHQTIAGATAAIVGFLALGPSVWGDLVRVLEASASDDRTWQWRVDGWGRMWSQHLERGPESFLLGSVYGTPWDATSSRALEGRVGTSPHNFYVRSSIRLGIVAALIIVWKYMSTVARAGRSRTSVGALIAALLVQQLVYSIPYDPTLPMALIFGASLAWVRVLGHSSGPDPTPSVAPRGVQEVPFRRIR